MNRVVQRRARRKSGIIREVSAIQILEEAFHLLRMASGGLFWKYFIGTVPFACLLFHGWAEASLTQYRAVDSAWLALLLAIAFFWKASFQAVFCRGLWEMINPGHPPRLQGWQKFRSHAALWFFQVFSILGVALSVFFIIPLPWALSASQNGSVLALTQPTGKACLRQLLFHAWTNSHYQWAQNFGIWMATGAIALLAWINLLTIGAGIPAFFKTMLGMENQFTTNPAALTNSTFVFGILLVTWLILSPLIKAVFVLRCFYAESRVTGADLLARLAELRQDRSPSGPISPSTGKKSRPGSRSAKTTALLLFLLATAGPQPGLAVEEGLPLAGPILSGQDMERAIEDTMSARKYEWKHLRSGESGENDEELNWFESQLAQIGEAVHEQARRIKIWLREQLRKAQEHFTRQERERVRREKKPYQIDTSGLSAVLSVLLIALVAALAAWLIYLLFKHYQGKPKNWDGESENNGAGIDLESEDITADLLEEDEWLKLAREQISKGEGRLAIRALFLATLAHLGERELLKIQKFKSNRDYCRELELKARQKNLLREAFSENTQLFERAWYGMHQIGEDSISRFMKNYETISAPQPT